MDVSSSLAALDEWVRGTTLARATAAARLGNYAAAEAVLQSASSLSTWADGLDLLARIRAQCGDFDSAAALWRQAARLPGAAQENLNAAALRAERWRDRRFGRGRLWLYAGGITLGAALLAMAVRRGPAAPGPTTPSAAPPALSASIGHPATSALAAPTSGAAFPQPVIVPQLSLPGISVRDSGGSLELTFEHGLFRRRAELTPEGVKTLRALAERLSPAASQVRLLVVGCADQRTVLRGSPYADNVELGLARAAIVANTIRRQAGLAADRITMTSLGESGAPHPAERNEGRDNRTVVIRVTTRP